MWNKLGIIYFPGSKSDYEEWKGYKVEIVGANADLYRDHILLEEKQLDEEQAKSIEALVNCQLLLLGRGEVKVFGLPVKRK